MVRAEVRSSSAGYGGDLQLQAQGWIEDVTGESFQGDFADGLRDGTRLCKLLNAIKPSSIRRVNPYKEGQKFKQMENISNFIRACRALGVPEYSLFETVDLYEGKDVGLVVKCLHALGGTVQLNCPEFEGPHLGLKPVSRTSPQKRAPGAAPAKTWSAASSSSSSSGPARSWATPSSAKPPVSSSAASSSPPYGSRANANGAGDGAGGPASSSSSSSSSFSPSPSSSSSPASSLTPTETLPPPPSFDPAAPKIVGRAPQEKGAPSPPPYNGTAQRWGPGGVQDAATAAGMVPAATASAGTPSTAGGSKDALPPPPAYRSDLSTKFDESVSVAETRNGSTSPHGDLGRPANGSPPAARNGHTASNGASKKQPQAVVEATHGGSGSSGGGDRWSSSPRGAPAASSGGAPATVAATPAATAHAPELLVVGASATMSPDRSPTGRGGGYGLDAELAARREANYDYDAEAEAREWIEDVTGEAFASGFAEELKDGSRLCLLINCIKPGAVRRVNNSKMPFKQMENVSNFLKACRAVGVAEHSLFETVDLYEGKDIGLVVRCLHALGQTVQKSCPEYDGPRLGVRQTDANKREWTAEQQQQQQRHSSGAMSQLMAGSSKTMERGSVIKTGVTFGATQSGTGDPSAMSGWTMGSAKTMDRSHIAKSGPTFGAEYAGASEDASGAASRFTAGHRC